MRMKAVLRTDLTPEEVLELERVSTLPLSPREEFRLKIPSTEYYLPQRDNRKLIEFDPLLLFFASGRPAKLEFVSEHVEQEEKLELQSLQKLVGTRALIRRRGLSVDL